MYGETFPITICIGNTCEYLSVEDFKKLKTKLNSFAIPVSGKARCGKGYINDNKCESWGSNCKD